jgi:iron(III) transport system permease protein
MVDFPSWLPTAIPGAILGLGFLFLFLGTAALRPLYSTIFVLIVASAINSMTLGVQLLKTNMLQLGREMEEASWVSGGSWFYTFRRVLLPVFAPAFVATALLVFVLATRNVSHIAVLVTSETRPLSMLMLDYIQEARHEAAAVVGVITVLITIGAALIARRFGLR